ncbi:MAG TPA: hypothetical protein VIK18_16000 [Pirellulales bacterium]
MRNALAFGLCGCILLVSASSLRADAETELFEVVPDSALGVVVVNRLKDTSERLEKLGHNLQIGIPSSPLGFAKALAGITQGVDERGSVAIALFSGGDAEPPVGAVFIPVNSYAEFLAGLDAKIADAETETASANFFTRPALVSRKADYAVLVDPKQERLLKEIKASTSGIEKLVKPFGGWLTEQAVAGLALEPGTQRIFESLEKLVGRLEHTGGAAGNRAANSKPAVLANLKQFKGEITRCGLGIELADRGAIFSIKAAWKSGGWIAQQVAETRWPDAPPLQALPAGSFVFAGAGILPRPWLIALAHAKLRLLWPTTVLGGEQQKQLDQALAEMVRPIQSVAMLLRPPVAGRSFLNQLTLVITVDDARRFLAAYEKNLPPVEKLLGQSKTSPLISKLKTVELEGLPALEIEVDLSTIAAADAAPDSPAATIMDTLLGSERQLPVYLAAIDEHRVAVSYGSRSGALETAKALRAGKTLAADPNVQPAVALLPKRSNWVGLADLSGVVQSANALLPALAPNARRLPEFPQTLPVVARTQFAPLALDARLMLPTELLATLGAYVAKVRQLQQED